MNITTFNPQILSNDAKALIEVFEALGFKQNHDKTDIGELKVEGLRMKDANGFALDISVPELPLANDMMAIRMNVDDFDEAYRILTDHGFKNFYGDKTVHTESSVSAFLISESGFGINLVEHTRKK